MVRLIYGDHTSLLHLHKRSMIAEASMKGKIVLVDPSESEVESLFSPWSDPEPSLIVWNKVIPKKVDPSWIDPSVDILVVLEGELKKGNPWAEYKKTEFKAPKAWEEESDAAEQFRKMLERQGRKIDYKLAKAVVGVAGSDMGLLAFEAMKLVYVSEQEVGVSHIRAVTSKLAAPDGDALVSYILRREAKNVVSIMDRLEQNSSSDPTMGITLGILQPRFLQWWYALRAGSVDAAAEVLGIHKWVVENKVWPQATLMGEKRVGMLLKAVGDAHRSVNQGTRSWNVLKFGILEAIAIE